VEDAELVSVPLLGRRTIVQHQRILFILLAFSLVVLGAVSRVRAESGRPGRPAGGRHRAVADAVATPGQIGIAGAGGEAQAFPDVKESADVLAKTVRGLSAGDDQLRLQPCRAELLEDVNKITPLMERAEKNAGTVMGQQKILTQVGNALRTINRQSSDLLEIAETCVVAQAAAKRAAGRNFRRRPAGDVDPAHRQVGQRIPDDGGREPEAVFLLGKDLNSFKEIAQGLLDGSPELRLAGSKDEQTRERLMRC
jgi:twitching motility protein PilJ